MTKKKKTKKQSTTTRHKSDKKSGTASKTKGRKDRVETRERIGVSKLTGKKEWATTTGESGFPVVGIGASAGGLEALRELFSNMPADTGMAFVVVTHQHLDHTSLLPELLGKETEMSVIEAADGTKLEPCMSAM